MTLFWIGWLLSGFYASYRLSMNLDKNADDNWFWIAVLSTFAFFGYFTFVSLVVLSIIERGQMKWNHQLYLKEYFENKAKKYYPKIRKILEKEGKFNYVRYCKRRRFSIYFLKCTTSIEYFKIYAVENFLKECENKEDYKVEGSMIYMKNIRLNRSRKLKQIKV
jgi:hypothetical protein